MSDPSDLLDALLSVAAEELPCASSGMQVKKVNNIKEDEKFLEENSNFLPAKRGIRPLEKITKLVQSTQQDSNVPQGKTDSSEYEDCYFQAQKYDSFGNTVEQIIVSTAITDSVSAAKSETTWQTKTKQLCVSPATAPIKADVYTDPVFGIRIVNPLVSGSLLKERMGGRIAISMANVKAHVKNLTNESDWVIAGVIVRKSTTKTSQKGSTYLIWTLSDLHNDLKTVTIFLFRNAYKQLWKNGIGTVVGILNPSIFDRSENSLDEASLFINNAQKVMILGQSKDLGTCKSFKKSGDRCTAFVNVNKCEFCIYHIKLEYQKCTKRSELQSNFSGHGLNALRNKVLGKNEVFYAGKSFTAVPLKKNVKLAAKDDRRLNALSGITVNANRLTKVNNCCKNKVAAHLELSRNQRAKDLEMLKKLGGISKTNFETSSVQFNANLSNEVSLEDSKQTALNVISKLKAVEAVVKNSENKEPNVNKQESHILKSPKHSEISMNNLTSSEFKEKGKETTDKLMNPLSHIIPSDSQVNKNFTLLPSRLGNRVDLNVPTPRQFVNRAKLNALKWVEKNGQIKKTDPMNSRRSGKKRPFNDVDMESLNPKQQKIQQNEYFSERFKKMMATTSANVHLLDQRDNQEQEKYFDKLEKKEQMEEKMLATYKLQCKAVRCLKCKYTNFSAADFCKTERHPLKVFDAVKRFFKCGDCGNRTVTLDIVPTIACKNCGSGKWERAAMMKEKMVSAVYSLSIRGGEQTFLNSVSTNVNLDLLLPDN